MPTDQINVVPVYIPAPVAPPSWIDCLLAGIMLWTYAVLIVVPLLGRVDCLYNRGCVCMPRRWTMLAQSEAAVGAWVGRTPALALHVPAHVVFSFLHKLANAPSFQVNAALQGKAPVADILTAAKHVAEVYEAFDHMADVFELPLRVALGIVLVWGLDALPPPKTKCPQSPS